MPRPPLDPLISQDAGPQGAARWVRRRMADVKLPEVHAGDAERVGREVADWVQARLARREPRRGSEVAAVVWPTICAAAGAGAAFWWWTQWSRGRAEAERDASGGEAGAAHPQDVLAHAPPPADAPPPPSGHIDALAGHAEQVLAHAPAPFADLAQPPSAKTKVKEKGKGKPKKVKPTVDAKAAEALERNLAVQASAEPPKDAADKAPS